MLAQSIRVIVVLAALCVFTGKASSNAHPMRRSGLHRRAVAHHQRRQWHEDVPAPKMMRKLRRGDSNAHPTQSDLGNIDAMKKFVAELKQMNTDWQNESAQALKDGKAASEFPSTENIANPTNNGQGNSYSKSGSKNNETHDSQKATSEVAQQKPKSKSLPKQKKQKHPKKHKSKAHSESQAKQKTQPKQETEQQPKTEQKQQHPKTSGSDNNSDSSTNSYKSNTNDKSSSSEDDDNLNLPAGVARKYPNGSMTYYDTGLGACGWVNKDTDFIAALSSDLWNKFGSMSNGNPACHRKIRICVGSKCTIVEVTDECPGCEASHLDLSPSAFQYFADLDVGLASIQWEWV